MTIFCTSAPPTLLRLIHSSYTQLCRPQIHFALIKASDVKFVFQVVIQSFYVDVKVSEYSDGDKKGTMGKKKCLGVKQQCSLFKKIHQSIFLN